MSATAQQILESLDDPEMLEALYRQNPDSFHRAFREASRTAPASDTIRIWRARLE